MSATEATEAQMLPEFARGRRAFSDELAHVRRALRRRGVRREDAEDLAQEVFLVMWRRWSDYDPARPLRPWLSGIAARVAQDFRKRVGRELPIGLINPVDEAAPDAEERLARQRHRAAVGQALAAMRPKDRRIFELADMQGVPIRMICVLENISSFTAYARLRHARHAFAKALRRQQLVRDVLRTRQKVGSV